MKHALQVIKISNDTKISYLSINSIDNGKYNDFAKVAESLKASITNDAKKEAQIATSAPVNSNGGDKITDPFSFYQRALGCFIRIEIKNGYATSNDEDFHRYGASFYTRFFGFLCISNQGWPQTQAEVNTSDISEGYKALQTKLRVALRARMETCNK